MDNYIYNDVELKGKEINFIYQILLNTESSLSNTLREMDKSELAYNELSDKFFICKQCRMKFEDYLSNL